MEISFDPQKRLATLRLRGLDFADAATVFSEAVFTREDRRFSYPEPRFLTSGLLHGRSVMIVWTPTSLGRRIISMRYSHAKELRDWRRRLD